MRVSVFGGSQPKEDSTAYAEAIELGRLLAQRGHTVLTGGYIGVMEAVGHFQAAARFDVENFVQCHRCAWLIRSHGRFRRDLLSTGGNAAVANQG